MGLELILSDKRKSPDRNRGFHCLRFGLRLAKHRRSKDKVQRVQEKQVADDQVLLATHEDETAVSIPDEVRAAAAAVEPRTTVRPSDVEHAEAAIRVGNGLHGHDDPFVHGLVGVLQTQLRADFCWAEFETELDGLVADLLVGGVALEAEFGHRHPDQVDFLLGHARREGGLAEDVVRPVADFHSSGLEGIAETCSVLDACAEFDGLPDLELVRHLGEPHLEQILNSQESLVQLGMPCGIPNLRNDKERKCLVQGLTDDVETSWCLRVLRRQSRHHDTNVISKNLTGLVRTTNLLDESVELAAGHVSNSKPFTGRSHRNLLGLMCPVSVTSNPRQEQ